MNDARCMNIEQSKPQWYDVLVMDVQDGSLVDVEYLRPDYPLTYLMRRLLDSFKALNEASHQNSLCHGNLHPSNVLFSEEELKEDQIVSGSMRDKNMEFFVSDFGVKSKLDGRPGWALPNFISAKKTDSHDLYSMGWLCLYLICKSETIFFEIRNAYFTLDTDELPHWLTKFRELREVEIIIKMIEGTESFHTCYDMWYNLAIVKPLTDDTMSQLVPMSPNIQINSR